MQLCWCFVLNWYSLILSEPLDVWLHVPSPFIIFSGWLFEISSAFKSNFSSPILIWHATAPCNHKRTSHGHISPAPVHPRCTQLLSPLLETESVPAKDHLSTCMLVHIPLPIPDHLPNYSLLYLPNNQFSIISAAYYLIFKNRRSLLSSLL